MTQERDNSSKKINNHKPWVEKYRPNKMEDIVLSKQNKTIFKTMIKTNNYPNMIFYGNPGTGKTTTILCLLYRYQNKHNCKNNYIHLNASHQRGIDVIRNQIQQFINNKNFFHEHKKFVLLDEVDSMTKQAQSHLYYIIKENKKNVCFILICNYLNKLIDSLRNSLFTITFHSTTKNSDTIIKKCIEQEKVKISKTQVQYLKSQYTHDLRSLINTLQNTVNSQSLIIQDSKIKTICENSQLAEKKIQQLHKFHDEKYIMNIIFTYIIYHYNVDYKLMKQMKYCILHKFSLEFLTHVWLTYFRKLNKIDL